MTRAHQLLVSVADLLPGVGPVGTNDFRAVSRHRLLRLAHGLKGGLRMRKGSYSDDLAA